MRKWETFRVNYMCFLTPPPPPPLLFPYVKGKWPVRRDRNLPSDTKWHRQWWQGCPPRGRLLRKQGEKEAQTHKAQSPVQCSWWSTSPHNCRNQKPLTPPCPLSSVLIPHGRAMLTCRYKMWALLYCSSFPHPSAEAPIHLHRLGTANSTFPCINHSN